MTQRDEHFDDLLGAYLLGACPEPEAALVAEHLANCPACAREAERLRAGSDALLAGVPRHDPGEHVKSGVMAEVRAEAALFEAARGRDDERATPRTTLPARAWWSSVRSRMRVPVPAVAACALLLAAAGGALLANALRSEAPTRSVLSAQINDQRAPDGAASLEIQGERARLRVRGFPEPGRGRVYQVWVRKRREVPRPAEATFTVDARGRGQVRLPGDISGVDQVLVTSEPAGGSSLPTRVPVLRVDTSPA